MQKIMNDGSLGPVEPIRELDELLKVVSDENVHHVEVFGLDEARRRIAELNVSRKQKRIMLDSLAMEERRAD